MSIFKQFEGYLLGKFVFMSASQFSKRACLTDAELEGLLSAPGELEDVSSIETHLASCEQCVQRLDLASVASACDSVKKQLVPDFLEPDGLDAETIQVYQSGRETDPMIDLSAASPDAATNALPSIAGYEVHELIGRGGMGLVYRATHNELNRTVALKMISGGLLAGPERIRRFNQEVKALAKLDHANIVKVFDVGAHAGQPYFAMELVEGHSLDQCIEGTPWPPKRAAKLVSILAAAMDVAHGQDVIHRDLKPANVLLAGKKPSGTPKIIDFGLARDIQHSAITQSGDVFGSPSYMSPEQALGRQNEIGVASDVYSLGSILYELLTGRPPFIGSSAAETLSQIINEEPVRPKLLNTSVPKDLETICLKCIEKPIGRRYLTASELASDLRNYLDVKPIFARPASSVEKAWKLARRYPAWTTAIFVAIVSTAVLVGMWAKFTKDLAAQTNYALAQKAAAEHGETRAVKSELKAKANEELAKKNEQVALRNEKIAQEQVEIQEQTYLFTTALVSKLKTLKKNDELVHLIVETEKAFDDSFDDRPVLKAAYLSAVARTFLDISELDLGLERIDRAIEIFREETPDSIHLSSAKIIKIMILMGMDRLTEAVRLRRTLDLDQFEIVDNDLLLLVLFDAKDLMDNRKFDEAEQFLLNVLDKEGVEDPTFRYQAVGLLGVIKSRANEHNEAATYFKEHLRLAEASGVAGKQTLIRARHRLTHSLGQTGDVDKAIENYQIILNDCIEQFGDEHALTLEIMINLALAYGKDGQYAKAKELNQRVAVLSLGKFGQRHSFSLTPLTQLGRDATNNDDSESFVKFVNENLDLEVLEERDDYLSTSLMVHLAKAHAAMEQLDQANKLLVLAKENAVKGNFPAHPILDEIKAIESSIADKKGVASD